METKNSPLNDDTTSTNQSPPLISIIIRCYNDIKFIKKTIQSILKQEGIDKEFSVELIVADNESTDGSLEVIKEYSEVKLISIPKGSYKPGPVLNQCITKSHGDILVFNNSDCVPQNKYWLIELVQPIMTEESKITFARQLPRPNAWPLVRKDNIFAFPESIKNFNFFIFSLASCACHRSVWASKTFSENLQYSEDIEWGLFHHKNGTAIKYCPTSQVEHSHNYETHELKNRFYNEGKAEYFIFGTEYFKKYKTSYFWPSLLSKVLKDMLFLIKNGQFSWFFKGIAYRFRQQTSLRSGYFEQQVKNEN